MLKSGRTGGREATGNSSREIIVAEGPRPHASDRSLHGVCTARLDHTGDTQSSLQLTMIITVKAFNVWTVGLGQQQLLQPCLLQLYLLFQLALDDVPVYYRSTRRIRHRPS